MNKIILLAIILGISLITFKIIEKNALLAVVETETTGSQILPATLWL